MLYHPKGKYVWDTWYYICDDELHCIHLQVPRPDFPCSSREAGALGHAVSDDLVHWRNAGIALYPGDEGSYDDDGIWTGCVEKCGEVYYMYYTARAQKEQGRINRIALATSTDGWHWTKHAQNPILIPDGRWYANEYSPIRLYGHGYPIVDCRDMCVVKDPEGKGYWGFFAARRHAQTNAETSVIALAHSDDLIRWEQYPPCFEPKHLGCVEVPEVFYLNGKWYMLCLTGNMYGHRGCTSDPLVRKATLYAVADNVWGPYQMNEQDNVLLGSVFHQGYSCKTILWKGMRTLFFTQGEYKAGSPHGCISRPQQIIVNESGRLRLRWHPACDALYEPANLGAFENIAEGHWGSIGQWEVAEGEISGRCDGDWAILPAQESLDDGCIECTVTLGDARSAGICFRLGGENIMAGGLVVLLDRYQQQLVLTAVREFPNIEARTFPVRQDRPYRLKVMCTGNVINVYVDEELWIQCYEPCASKGRVALFVEHGSAIFSELQARRERKS